MLSETPTNNAVNFVTGAGGFLQQVIYGYTGLRFGTRGWSRRSSRCCPRAMSRLILRDIWLQGQALRRGGRLDRTADGAAPRDPADELARAHARCCWSAGAWLQAGRRLLRCSPFPNPGWTTGGVPGLSDPLLPRFQDNTVQIYLQPQGARAVLVWADAANESAGSPCATPAGGRPRSPGAHGAEVSDSASFRGASSIGLAAEVPRVKLGWFVLGSMRVERDFVYARRHLAAVHRAALRGGGGVAAGRGGQPAAGGRAAAHLALLRARTWMSSRPGSRRPSPPRQRPVWTMRLGARRSTGATTLVLELSGDPRTSAARVRDRTVSIETRPGRRSSFRVRVTTNAAPLTPLSRQEIFNPAFLSSWRAPTTRPRQRRAARPAAGAAGARRRAPEQPREADGRPAQLRHLLRPRHDDDRAHDAADLVARRWRST